MPSANSKQDSRETSNAKFWQRMALVKIPIISGILNNIAVQRLISSSQKGSAAHAEQLAELSVSDLDPELRTAAFRALTPSLPVSSWNGIWAAWVNCRSPRLLEVLLKRGKNATYPESIRVLSLLVLGEIGILSNCIANSIPHLIQALHDSDPVIAGSARAALERIKRGDAISALCQAWGESRASELTEILKFSKPLPEKPIEIRVLVALKFQHLDTITEAGTEVVSPLITALSDNDPEIAAAAAICIRNLKNQEAIDQICALWNSSRNPVLAEIIQHAGYVARQPIELRTLCLLKTGKIDLAASSPAHAIQYILAAADDLDQEIRSNAISALHSLKLPEAQAELCKIAALQEHQLAKSICLERNYQPVLVEDQALYLFLTDQFEVYDAIDFDYRILSTYYATTSENIRKKISQKIQTSGKIQYLSILTGQEGFRRAEILSNDEFEVTFRSLVAAEDWPQLWKWAHEFPLAIAIRAVQQLASVQWQPSHTEMAVFSYLCELTAQPLPDFSKNWFDGLPYAVPRAFLNLKGRINDVAFSPASTLLAIGTNQGKVAIWNFQKASLETVIPISKRSIGKVLYADAQILAISEKTTRTGQPCQIFLHERQKTCSLGQHAGSVISLDKYGSDLLISTGRDAQVVVWNFKTHQQLASRQYPFWPRSLCISNDLNWLLLCHNHVYQVNLPELNTFKTIYSSGIRSKLGYPTSDMIQVSMSLPHTTSFLTGHYNGNLILWQKRPDSDHFRRSLIYSFDHRVVGLELIPDHSLGIAAASSGELLFFSQNTLLPVQKIPSAAGRITSMHISSDGSFLATGSADSQMVLWDLRTLDLPVVLSKPIAAMPLNVLPGIQALAEGNHLPDPIITALKILATLLQRKFQYDIQVSEPSQIQAGQFDILVE